MTIESAASTFVGYVWGLPLVFLLLGSGLAFTIIYRFPQIRFFKHGIQVISGKFDQEDEGEISHFQALCTALSATIGLGNIAGVAVAVSAGGPGAVFWMWVAAFLGMATKFTSISLSLIFRDVNPDGTISGGPMYSIKHGLGKYFLPLAYMYAFFTVLNAFGAGNMFQANQMAAVLCRHASIPVYASGIVFAILAGSVLIGGIRRIGRVAAGIVPFMVILYLLGAIGILAVNYTIIPELFARIFSDAFSGTAAVGGFAGIAFREVVIQGVRRAVFSNEAGMGTAAMAHSAARSKPVREGIVGLLGPFIDTIVVCTLTALVLTSTGVWARTNGLAGSELTAAAFATVYGEAGSWLVTLTVVLFAFSTIISWSYYGEQGMVFLVGKGGVPFYRYIYICFIMVGAIYEFTPVLNLSDALFGLLAIPNLIANFILTGSLKRELKGYEASL